MYCKFWIFRFHINNIFTQVYYDLILNFKHCANTFQIIQSVQNQKLIPHSFKFMISKSLPKTFQEQFFMSDQYLYE